MQLHQQGLLSHKKKGKSIAVNQAHLLMEMFDIYENTIASRVDVILPIAASTTVLKIIFYNIMCTVHTVSKIKRFFRFLTN